MIPPPSPPEPSPDADRDREPELSEAARSALEPVVALLEHDSAAPSGPGASRRAWTVHVADSLSGLVFADLRSARAVCDVGSGAGFPGLVLAAMLPEARVDLIESVGRKCEFIERAIAAGGLANARAVNVRAEEWAAADGHEAYDAVTARAVGRLSTLAELASPLLPAGGVLVAWKGRRDPGEESELGRAAVELAMTPEEVRHVGPYGGSEHRHLHLVRKVGETPSGLPRRPGMAKKRPAGT